MLKNRIIVIEDDKDINKLIAYNLKKEGFLVEQVYDGSKARQRLSESFFDIVILDIMLPGRDGFAICKEFKENEKYSRSFFIIASAKTEPKDRLYAHILGADLYFTKPFLVGELVEEVKKLNFMQNKEYSAVR